MSGWVDGSEVKQSKTERKANYCRCHKHWWQWSQQNREQRHACTYCRLDTTNTSSRQCCWRRRSYTRYIRCASSRPASTKQACHLVPVRWSSTASLTCPQWCPEVPVWAAVWVADSRSAFQCVSVRTAHCCLDTCRCNKYIDVADAA